MEEIFKKAPTPDILFYVVRGKTVLASEQFKDGRADAGVQTLADCRALLQSTMSAHSKDSAYNYRAFQGYQMILQQDRDPAMLVKDVGPAKKDLVSTGSPPATRPAESPIPEQMKKDMASTTVALDAVMRNAADSDPRFSEYHYAASSWARQTGHLDESEKVLRALYEGHKNDPRARLELARILTMTGDAAKRDEAVALLDRPVVLTGAGRQVDQHSGTKGSDSARSHVPARIKNRDNGPCQTRRAHGSDRKGLL